MDQPVEIKIREFAEKVKNEYKNINITYIYDHADDNYSIYHNVLGFDSEEFQKTIGKFIRICFFDNDIYNISFAYRI